LDQLEKEEQLREKAGLYDEELSSDDEDKRELRRQAFLIRQKQLLASKDSRERKHSTKPRMPRQGRKRERSGARLERDLESLGVDVSVKKMRHLSTVAGRRSRSVKKLRVARSKSQSRGSSAVSQSTRSRSRSKSRVEIGLPDEKTRAKAILLSKKAQKKSNRLAKIGEADRRIPSKMPKHLFTGKRGIGKTDRR